MGAVQNGGKCVFACDINAEARKAYQANFGLEPKSDITQISGSEIPDHDMLCAGFPCQPFSIIGNRLGFGDVKGTLFFDIARIIQAKKPRFAILENVKQLATHDNGRTLKIILETLESMGYLTYWKILNALDYGLPQKRERLIIVCFREYTDFSFPPTETSYKPLFDILEKDVDRAHYASDRIVKKRKEIHTSSYKLAIWHENKGGNINSYPFACALRAGASYNYLLVNGERRLTPREMLRLQGFPDVFKIVCSGNQTRKQAGNAVPVPIISKVIRGILNVAEIKERRESYTSSCNSDSILEERSIKSNKPIFCHHSEGNSHLIKNDRVTISSGTQDLDTLLTKSPVGQIASQQATTQIINADCIIALKSMLEESVDLIMTSPPYADQRKHTYGGIPADKYVAWFLPITDELHRVLKPSGSFILNIKEHVANGERHTYVMEIILAMRKQSWVWTEEYIWHKRNSVPGKWPNRFRNAWERCIHFTKERKFNMYQEAVMMPTGDWRYTRLKSLRKADQVKKSSSTGSGFTRKAENWVGREMAYPTNVLHLATECANKGHSAVFPESLPEWFIKLFIKAGDTVLDPFMGSGTTLMVSERLERNSIGIELFPNYCDIAVARLESQNSSLKLVCTSSV